MKKVPYWPYDQRCWINRARNRRSWAKQMREQFGFIPKWIRS